MHYLYNILMYNTVVFSGPIAQLVELPAHNRLVPGSSPGGPTTDIGVRK